MKMHENVLTSRQKKFIQRIGQAVMKQGFYLAGGTALAAYVGTSPLRRS